MKHLLLTAALIGLGSAAAAQDWSGAYVGVQTTNSSFSNTYYFANDTQNGAPLDGGGSMSGLFAGYNHQIGNVVVGGELSYLSGDPAFDLFPGYSFSDMLDLKARAGFSLGRVMPYAVIGLSRTEWTNGPATPVNGSGFAFGAGAEVQVTDRVQVGLEYLKRDLTMDDFVEFPGEYIEGDFSTVTLRVGYQF